MIRGLFSTLVVPMLVGGLGGFLAGAFFFNEREDRSSAVVSQSEVVSEKPNGMGSNFGGRVEAAEKSYGSPERNVLDDMRLQQIESLSKLAVRVERLESIVAHTELQSKSTYDSQLSMREQMASIATQMSPWDRRNLRGESSFTEDSGPPLGISDETVLELLYESDTGLAAADIHCKRSVCKVTFDGSGPASQGNDSVGHPGDPLLEKLYNLPGIPDFDVHYSVDESGEAIMYISSHRN